MAGLNRSLAQTASTPLKGPYVGSNPQGDTPAGGSGSYL